MKLSVAVVLLLSAFSSAQLAPAKAPPAPAILAGYCSANNPNNSTSQFASFFVGLGIASGSTQCLSAHCPVLSGDVSLEKQ